MRMSLLVPLIVAGLCWASPARAYDLIEVRSGDVLVVRQEGEILVLKLGGVWVPAPSGAGVEVNYRGDEARQFVRELLYTEAAFVQVLEPRDSSTHVVEVRIRVGEDEDRDLAVLLAEAGLALTERTTAEDGDHADAIYQGERAARRARRGMHDGGLMQFTYNQRQQWDLGTQMVATSLLRTRGSNIVWSTSPGLSPQTPSSNTRGRGIHPTAIDAIHDWGARLGLPQERTVWGH